MKIVLFAHDYVGKKIMEFFIKHKNKDLSSVVLMSGDKKNCEFLIKKLFCRDRIFFSEAIYKTAFINFLKENQPDYIILAWWPFIIKKWLLSVPQKGIINFHPSYLPYNRGKDPNFWSLAEGTPFGVSLQFIDQTIDGGDIIFRKKIKKEWTDTGKTLYLKGRKEVVKLFIDNYENIMKGNFRRTRQDLSKGTIHYRKELEPASQIFLNKKYLAKDLINLLRARTFHPHPACYFYHHGKKYEIRIEITEATHEPARRI